MGGGKLHFIQIKLIFPAPAETFITVVAAMIQVIQVIYVIHVIHVIHEYT